MIFGVFPALPAELTKAKTDLSSLVQAAIRDLARNVRDRDIQWSVGTSA
jgi:hypothetical protein